MANSWAPCFFIVFIILQIAENVESGKPITAMFVFGDSYVDTGNHDRTTSAWQPPYGISFPGKPSGRHSDGKVLTDLIASFFNISTPLPYTQRDSYPNQVSSGMNFASGGTGVFDTVPGLPNATAQIDQLENIISKGVYSNKSFASSLVLFSISGNDYGFYIQRKQTVQGLVPFAQSVVKQFSLDLERLYSMGFRQFAVTDMGPLGCLPLYTQSNSFARCNDTANGLAIYHNSLLQTALKRIKHTRMDARIVVLDQYSDSMSIFQHPHQYGKFVEALKPCCMGACGVRDSGGKALYSVCEHPEDSFFWDVVHPTQAAWQALMIQFASSLHSFVL